VTGQSELVVLPDQAVVLFSINTNAPTAQEAQLRDTALTKQVQDALTAQGIPASKIETANYYLSPKTDWTASGSVDDGFSLNHQFKVTTGDLQTVSKIIEVAVGAGANGVDNIDYELSLTSKANASAEAMKLATLAASDKAEKVAQAMGLHAGKPLKIEEGSWWFQTPSGASDTGAQGGTDSGSVAPHALAILANVNAAFSLR